MNEPQVEIQSTQTLFKATFSAAVLASLILLIAILPAEYNIDPTGIGQSLGFTRLATSSDVSSSSATTSATKQGYRSDTATIIVPARGGIEYKFQLPQYGKLKYRWVSNNEKIYFDFHGEPQGDTSGFFESYAITRAGELEGTLTVPFAGSHGWYWRNDSNKPITITLITSGLYEIIDLKK